MKEMSGKARERLWHTWLSGLIALEQWFGISNVVGASNIHNLQLESEIVKFAKGTAYGEYSGELPRQR